MKIWIIQHHHRHGVDTWPVVSDGEPDLEEIENGLDDFEPEREEFLEAAGPFDLPDKPTEPTESTVRVFDPIDTCDT
jgi:hypothetical protein